MTEVPEETVVEIRQGTQAAELISDQIERLTGAAEDLLATGLTERALIVLLQDRIGAAHIRKSDIRAVLLALPELRQYVEGDE